MRKLYLSPTCGRSHDLAPELAQFLQEEECNYRMTCSESQLAGLNPDVPQSLIDSRKDGVEVVTEVVRTVYGEEESYVSWDAPGKRYFIEFNDLEESLDDLMMGLGLRVILECRDRSDPFQEEFLDMVYGFPAIDENDRTAELETESFPRQTELEEKEEWQ